MQKHRLNNKGVSTIIAAALIVALTVILAVALGSTVLSYVPQAVKPYQLTITGEASASGNIIITHIGGDPINLDTVTIKTYIPSGTYAGVVYTIPKDDYSNIENWMRKYNTPTGSATFQVGDTLTIPFNKAFAESVYGLMAPQPGEQFVVELYYNNQPITSVTIIVKP
ncbi:MAG: type IV pilin N-terminal domain-containing protein [Candidatus Bathyarchaeota archaeon]|nr:type IV pilin N-terminal domain-containing protein [Candidatus Bathyarchaeota archaeon]